MLFFTSVTLYLSEAVLFWIFFLGLWWATERPSRWLWRLLTGGGYVQWEGRVTVEELRRFCLYQVALVAVWSICFKGVLYTTLRHSFAHKLLANGQSLGIAIPAELVILLLMLVGLQRAFFGVARAVLRGRE